MVEIEVETRKIGGSIGVILPSNLVRQQKIKAHEKIKIDVKKARKIGDFFGEDVLEKSTEEIMKEVKKGWK